MLAITAIGRYGSSGVELAAERPGAVLTLDKPSLIDS